MIKNFYLVTAKCGHVGKGKYYEVDFPVYANDRCEAAQYVLKRSKVKKTSEKCHFKCMQYFLL